MKGFAEGKCRLVLLGFSFSNLDLIPQELYSRGEESLAQEVARKSSIRGKEILAPTSNVSGVKFLDDLAAADYELVDANSQIRERDGRKYAVVKFVFVPSDQVALSPDLPGRKEVAANALAKLLGDSMWRTRLFANPFFKDGEVVEEAFSLSVNFEGRNPLVDGNGQPIMVWPTDKNGNRIGTEKMPLAPRQFLRVEASRFFIEQVL